jgi:hypothetical protein
MPREPHAPEVLPNQNFETGQELKTAKIPVKYRKEEKKSMQK